MKIDTKRLDHIIEEVLEEVLSEQSFVRDGDEATLDRINKQRTPVSVEPVKPPEWAETYFKSNPGLREKYTKAYSDPNFRARADAHDAKVIANNKKYALNKKKGNVTIRQPQLTSVQLMGNKVLDDWYKNTSPEDRAMKDYSGNPSARAKFYKKMEKRAKEKGGNLDVSKLGDDDVYGDGGTLGLTPDAAPGTWDDPLGYKGQTQFKFQKDIVGKPGEKIDSERLKRRSKDFEGFHAGDLNISPEMAGTIEDVGTFILPTNALEAVISLVPFGKLFGLVGKQGTKIAEKEVAKELVSQGVDKAVAQRIAKARMDYFAKEAAEKAAAKKLATKGGIKPGGVLSPSSRLSQKPPKPGFLGRSKVEIQDMTKNLKNFASKYLGPETVNKAMRNASGKGFKEGAKGFAKGLAGQLHPMHRLFGSSWHGAPMTYVLAKIYNAQKGSEFDQEALAELRDILGLKTLADVERAKIWSDKEVRRQNKEAYELDRKLMRGGSTADRSADIIIDGLINSGMVNTIDSYNINVMRELIKSMKSDPAYGSNRVKFPTEEEFIKALKAKGIKLDIDTPLVKEHIVNLVMETLGY
jgi:hypothetical protein